MSDKNEPKIGNLAMLVARLVRQVRKYDPTNDVAEKAMDYLRRKDLAGSVLREIKLNDMTPEEADAAYEAAPSDPISDGEVESLVAMVMNKEQG